MNHSKIGKIKSLALRDFLTYDELSFFPGDNLNIIIGPNGTGKSTIVAGIILGCGGKPVLLSRSKDISDYVKNGKQKAHIEITLTSSDNEDVIIFHRSFDKQSKETFSVNGQSVVYKEYLLRIKQFNIQVDNLCMFLPQDRVQDFTKLNPQELLHNTQVSVCSADINDAFKKLLEIRDKQKNTTKTNVDLQTRLEDNRNRNEQLRTLIENNKAKDALIGKVDMLLKKKAWCEFEEYGKNFREVDADMKVMTEKMKMRTDDLKPLQKKQQSIASTKNELKNSISKVNSNLNATIDEMDKLKDAGDKVEGDVNRAKQNMKNIISSVRDHSKQVKELELLVNFEKNELENAKVVVEELGNVEEEMQQYDADIAKLKSATQQLLNKRNEITNKLDETINPSIRNCERKIATLGDTQRQRVENLRTNFEDAYKAFLWLQANRQDFKGQIFNPIMVEITVKERENAKYIENSVAMKDLQAFVCTDKSDMNRLVKKFRNEMKLAVSIVFSEQTDEVEFQPQRDINDYPPHLGLYSYLIDMIDGPAPVINYLCRLYQIHNVAVGDDQTFTNASQVPSDFQVFFSTNHRFSVTVSRYSKAKSTSSSVVNARNLLNVGVDTRLREREEKNMEKWKRDAVAQKQARTKLEDQMRQFEVKATEIRNQKKVIQGQIQQVRICSDKLRKKEVELENLKNRKVDVEKERVKFKNNVDALIGKLLIINERRVGSLIDFKRNFVQKDIAQKKLRVFEESTGNLDDQIHAIQREIDNTRLLYDKVKMSYEATKSRYKAKEKEALKLTDGLRPNDREFKYTAKFSKLPDTLDELTNLVEDLQGRIECIKGVDPRILSEYEERSKDIENLEHQLSNEKNRLEKVENDLKTLHNKWYPAIQEVVQTINQNFSDFFHKMGFVGEVEMTRKEERDYADYGIQIRVQYRDNEKLQALNRHVQSGGERAVAIAVYTLSLQHITSVPFRCVDEINQGMDPKNERKIFQMLVDITCKPDQSQYFFVTPKLLPDLPHSDLMTISVVHNGQNIEDPYIFLDMEEQEADDVEMLEDDDE